MPEKSKAIDSPLAVIHSVRSVLEGLAVLDIGCGEGGLAKLLAAEGALVTGIDPGPAAVLNATLWERRVSVSAVPPLN